MPRADVANGIRYDLNTVAYPASWIGGRSPMVTGSGMNMRLTDATGALLDVRQGVTNFDNVSSGATSIAATLDNALGAKGYYGIFGSHYDMSDGYEKTLYALAASRHVPVISAEQALTWLDGRAASNFTNLRSEAIGRGVFSLHAAEGAYGLQAMMPLRDAGGELVTIAMGGHTVDYRTEIIKGIQYAIFAAKPGDYEVTYSDFGILTPGMGNVTPKSTLAQGTGATSRGSEVASSSGPVDMPSQFAGRVSSEDEHLQAHTQTSQASDWWHQPIVVWIFGGGAVLTTSGVAWWLVSVRRR
jgi:hypothetical protein